MGKIPQKDIIAHENRMIKYKQFTEKSIENTTHYDDKNVDVTAPVIEKYKNTEIKVINADTVLAIMKTKCSGKLAALNFASYNSPGGGYLNGALAQEECLCLASNLYNVLSAFQPIYDSHKESNNNGLYENFVLYTPDIIFNELKKADIITSAAPNASFAKARYSVSNTDIMSVMKNRIDFVLMSAYKQEVDTLILGAFGCGVFGNNPIDVANIFKELLNDKYKNAFEKVIFAIPASQKNSNLKAFENVLKGQKDNK